MTKAIVCSLISILTFTMLGMICVMEMYVDDPVLLSMTASQETHEDLSANSDGIDRAASDSEDTKEGADHEIEINKSQSSSTEHADSKSVKINPQHAAAEEPAIKTRKVRLKQPSQYRNIIYKLARTHGIEPSLVHALITVESNWNTEAVSHRGAIGLMQLMPATANAMGINDPYNPADNIEGGIKYLRYLLDKFGGDITLAIAAYNAGPRRIIKFRGVPPIRETQKYVKRVLAIYNSDANPS